MIAELATALKKLPSEVLDVTLSEVEGLYVYWQRWPHEHRAATLHLRATTTWKPPEKPKLFKESTQQELADFARSFGALGGISVVKK